MTIPSSLHLGALETPAPLGPMETIGEHDEVLSSDVLAPWPTNEDNPQSSANKLKRWTKVNGESWSQAPRENCPTAPYRPRKPGGRGSKSLAAGGRRPNGPSAPLRASSATSCYSLPTNLHAARVGRPRRGSLHGESPQLMCTTTSSGSSLSRSSHRGGPERTSSHSSPSSARTKSTSGTRSSSHRSSRPRPKSSSEVDRSNGSSSQPAEESLNSSLSSAQTFEYEMEEEDASLSSSRHRSRTRSTSQPRAPRSRSLSRTPSERSLDSSKPKQRSSSRPRSQSRPRPSQAGETERSRSKKRSSLKARSSSKTRSSSKSRSLSKSRPRPVRSSSSRSIRRDASDANITFRKESDSQHSAAVFDPAMLAAESVLKPNASSTQTGQGPVKQRKPRPKPSPPAPAATTTTTTSTAVVVATKPRSQLELQAGGSSHRRKPKTTALGFASNNEGTGVSRTVAAFNATSRAIANFNAAVTKASPPQPSSPAEESATDNSTGDEGALTLSVHRTTDTASQKASILSLFGSKSRPRRSHSVEARRPPPMVEQHASASRSRLLRKFGAKTLLAHRPPEPELKPSPQIEVLAD